MRWLFVALIVIGLLGWIVDGSVLYARLVYVGMMLIAGTYLWSLISMRGVHLTRRVRTLRASMGDLFEERFEVRNAVRQTCAWWKSVV